jgi:tetratricopeptide (TPR) repeat protein
MPPCVLFPEAIVWAALIVLAQVTGALEPGGQRDFELCKASQREQSITACHRVASNQVLDKKRIGEAYRLLARWADGPADAITYLEQAIAQDPENGDYFGELGFQYHLLGDYDRALAEQDKGLALNPDSTHTLLVRSFVWVKKGEDGRALADLNRAIALEPSKPVFPKVKAEILLHQGRTSEALATLDRAAKANPGYVDFMITRAEVYRRLGDDAGELAALNRTLELNPKDGRALLRRALLYERQSKSNLAVADYDTLIALYPTDTFYSARRTALLKAKAEGAPITAPKVVGTPPPTTGKKSAGEAPSALECRVYIPAAALTVAVPCAK